MKKIKNFFWSCVGLFFLSAVVCGIFDITFKQLVIYCVIGIAALFLLFLLIEILKERKGSSKDTKPQPAPEISQQDIERIVSVDEPETSFSEPPPKPLKTSAPEIKKTVADSEWMIVNDHNYAAEVSDYIVFDVETTGLNSNQNRIIEFAAVKCENNQIIDVFSSLVNPEVDIPENITRMTGIDNAAVANAPIFSELAPKLIEFIGENFIVGHNASFDARFLEKELERAGFSFVYDCIDTLAMARESFPEFKNHKLKTLIKNLNLSNEEQEHRALSDAKYTQLLFERCKIRIVEQREAAFRQLIQDAEKYAAEDKGYKLDLVGIEYENRDIFDKAIEYYEKSIAAGFEGNNPFYRLSVLYRKRKDYASDIRICQKAMVQDNPHAADRNETIEYWQHRIDYSTKRLKN